MNADEAMSFVRDRGIVLASAKGPVPCLAEAIAGEPIRGSWWAHRKSHQIFAVLEKLGDSPDILSCRLVNGRVTLVHRRLWAALVRLESHFDRDRLAQVRDKHTPSGQHVSEGVAYPAWVPGAVVTEARLLSERDARRMLGPVAGLPRTVRPRTRR